LSISKENYHPKTDLFEQIKKRTNHKTQLIALSGISADNIRQTLISGFDDVTFRNNLESNNNRKFQIMSPNRPFVVSIAGFDPRAGVLTDIKTFEQHRVWFCNHDC
jgi:hypothetical protein